MIHQFRGQAEFTLKRVESLPLKRLHGAAALVCALAFSVDLIEMSASNALSAVFSSPPHALGKVSLSFLLASVYLGAIIGSPIVGRIADYRGLQRTLAVVVSTLGVVSLLSVARPTPLWFGSFRLLSGVTLGAYPPLMIAYLTAIVPSRYRGLTIFSVCAVAYVAPPLGVFLIRWLTPLMPLGIDGWRWPFLVSGCGALLAGAAFTRLPESIPWLLKVGRTETAKLTASALERSPILALPGWIASSVVSRAPAIAQSFSRPRKTFAFVFAVYATVPWFSIAFPLLTGPMLLKRGYTLSDTLLYIALAAVGPAAATLFTGLFIDRVTRRAALLFGCVVMLVANAVFFRIDHPAAIATSVIIFSICVQVIMPIMTLYGAELIPSSIRASATSLAWSGNRLSAMLVPLVLLPVLYSAGAGAVGLVVAGTLIVTATLVVLFNPMSSPASTDNLVVSKSEVLTRPDQ